MIPAVIAIAQAMIGQGLDDAALIHDAVRALRDHAHELGPDRIQTGQAPFDIRQLLAGDPVSGLARAVGLPGQTLQGAQVVESETEVPAMPDEAQLLQMVGIIAPLATR